MGNTQKKLIPWGVIVLFLIVFWPIGLALLVIRLASDRASTLKDGSTVIKIAVFLIILAIIFLAAGVTAWGVILIIGAACLIFYSRKMKITGEKYKRYIGIVVNHNMSSIDQIASAMPVPYDEAVADLEKMVKLGFFPNAYINLDARELVLPKQNVQPAAGQPGVIPPQVSVKTCTSCGANNSIIAGHVSACEYCGSPLG